jgi:hypothetical protein
MGRIKTRRMTAAEFDAVMLLMGQMSEPRRAAARRALVDGETGRSIADYYGWGRSAVGNAETAVWRVYQRYLKAKFAEQHSKQQAGRLLTTRQRK